MAAAIPRDAATVVVVRDAKNGIEVLLLQRAEKGDHNSGAWVFPGGLVDPDDRADEQGAFERAAVRECFEECGIVLAPERVHLVAHWLTPMGRAKRFDTRFFVTTVEALSPRNSRRLMTPTRAVLETLAPFTSAAQLQAWAAQPRTVERILPALAVDANGVRPLLPHEPAYDEVMKLDTGGRSDVWCEMRPGVETKLGEHVTRVMTEDGTNRYFVDGAEVDIAQPRLVEPDRIAIARDLDALPAAMRAQAQWLAPHRGFLRRL
jgi:8-oxo-dGTP pyrophosphatase MutT (NUDIX family)